VYWVCRIVQGMMITSQRSTEYDVASSLSFTVGAATFLTVAMVIGESDDESRLGSNLIALVVLAIANWRVAPVAPVPERVHARQREQW
jgi:hypothetical protein